MIKKRVQPESFDFGMPPVELVNVGSKGLDKQAMVKRASAFDDIYDKLEKKANRAYLHVITTGAFEKYGANSNCFTGDTRVITETGSKPISEIRVGDVVLTAEGEYKQVTRVYARSYTGKMVSVKVQGLPDSVTMTAEHPVMVVKKADMQYHYDRRRKGREDWETMAANLIEHTAGADGFRDADNISVEDSVVLIKRDASYGLNKLSRIPIDMIHNKPYLVDEYDLLTAYVFGLWVAEGCTNIRTKKTDKTKRYTPSDVKSALSIWTLNAEKDKGSIEALVAFADKYGLSLHTQRQGAIIHHRIGGSELAARIGQLFGNGAKNKYIHRAVFGMPDEWKLAFLDGYLDGDGNVYKTGKSTGTITASTVSIQLAYDIQALVLSLGRKASITHTHNYIRNGCFGHQDGDVYQVAICASQAVGLFRYCRRIKDYAKVSNDSSKNLLLKDRLYMRVTKVSITEVIDIPVYNLEVADSHTYCVPFIVHNCDAWNGDYMDWEFPYPENPQQKTAHFDGGLKKYHDDTYMKGGAVYQEHQTKTAGVDPSGEVIAARYNTDMQRGELLIAVDTEKWRDRLHKKASGKDIYLSIGASVPHDCCVLCGRMAKTADQHCDHFKRHRGQLYDCGLTACVMNDTPSFYDISGVDVPADRIAFVLRKMASVPGTMQKEASLDALMTMGSRRPILLTKAASILSKLAEMEKKVQGIIEGDKDVDLEAFRDDDDAKKDFILRVENYPADEVIDSSNRKGILLSPGMLFKILGNDLEDGDALKACGDDCCGDMSCMMQELEEDEDRNTELLDGSFDQHTVPDLNLDSILDMFAPEFSAGDGAINAKIIKVTISPREHKEQEKKASYNPQAEAALRKTYARYLISFAAQNDDSTCMNALMKIAALQK